MRFLTLCKSANSLLASVLGSRRHRPHVLQMPVTSRCNSRCLTCNVWKETTVQDIDPVKLENSLADPFFSEVRTVGINGGEFTLIPDFPRIVQAVLTLPSLQGIYLISNGLFPNRLFEYLQTIKKNCGEKHVTVHFCLSVDGARETHEKVRGIPGSFARTTSILQQLKADSSHFCDSWSIGCTLSRHNIRQIRETEAFLSSFEVPVEYHLAVPNKRIGTFGDAPYSVLEDEQSRLLAAEFFYCKYLEKGDSPEGHRYFSSYYYLKNKGKGRLCSCSYRKRDVTIDESLGLSLCATASDRIGFLTENSASDCARKGLLDAMEKKVRNNCDTCIHYAYHPLTVSGRFIFLKDHIRHRDALMWYRIKSQPKMRARIKESISLWLSERKYLTKGLLVYHYDR